MKHSSRIEEHLERNAGWSSWYGPVGLPSSPALELLHEPGGVPPRHEHDQVGYNQGRAEKKEEGGGD